ncbi:transcriptional regulator [Actinoplanes sp. OR16]|uniref:GAF and ANTAR domain-containing protein n=1 Tax=Actinoplanes sp. OR16 TaxID=946334 RepID=UPI000F7135E6|nr:GAF and ANTAR domain-containing protein [Actinoplanes sp. OR16]BBH67585.1 transcriptional regulator [Actinoplanes sp. OR16]
MSAIDPAALAASLRRLGEREEHDIASAVGEVIHAAADLFGVDGSGLMIADEQHDLRYVAASNRQSEVMERSQSTAGEGPCVAAFVTNDVVHTDDLHTDGRWPLIRETFLRNGVVSVLGAPVRLGGVPVGTLDVFRDTPHAWSEAEANALQRYTDLLESMLGAALAAHRAGELAGQLQYALDYRVVIERAVGYLMAQRNTGPDQAFSLLRSTSRNQRRKVAEVAAHLLETGSLPEPPA